MKLIPTAALFVAFATALAIPSLSTGAAPANEHQAHHPAAAASASAAKTMVNKPSPDMARMDIQMKGMREMHDQMMAAKTPEERSALMREHMQSMKNGMAMMSTMPSGSTGGMGDAQAMKNDMPMHHQMMEKRMEMMQIMMQMMMDRLPATPMK